MKIKHLKVAALFMAASLITSSCVGSFSLFSKLAHWNKGATNSKFLNEIIFLLISPAYAVCGVVDVLVLNTIEFWSGSNPIAYKAGQTESIMGKDGKYYAFGEEVDLSDLIDEDGELNVKCPVVAVAVQAAGFDNADAAITAAFGAKFNPFGGTVTNWQ